MEIPKLRFAHMAVGIILLTIVSSFISWGDKIALYGSLLLFGWWVYSWVIVNDNYNTFTGASMYQNVNYERPVVQQQPYRYSLETPQYYGPKPYGYHSESRPKPKPNITKFEEKMARVLRNKQIHQNAET